MVNRRIVHRVCGCIVMLLGAFGLHGQIDSSQHDVLLSKRIIPLPEATIKATKSIRPGILSVPNLLTQKSHQYVRTYGPSGLANVSSQGNSAVQTDIYYNGLNLQNPTLGLTDLSLYPSFLFTQIDFNRPDILLQRNIGRSIHLDVDRSIQSPVELQLKMGSFGQKEIGVGIASLSEKYEHYSRILIQRSNNDFKYRNLDGNLTRLSNARTRGISGITQHQFNIDENQNITFFALVSLMDREIPPTRFQPGSIAEQEDLSLKTGLAYTFENNLNQFQSTVAFLSDRVDYNNPMISILARNMGDSFVNQTSWSRLHAKHWKFNVGYEFVHSIGRSDAYNGNRTRNQLNISGGTQYNNDKWQIDLKSQIKTASGIRSFFLPTLSLNFNPNSRVALFSHFKRVARLPSLDDLFWVPGGNPNLLPELGWSQELGLSGKNDQNSIQYKAMIYHRQIDNWIIWLPKSNSIWSPENISKVRTYGLESDFILRNKLSKSIRLKNHLLYSYTHSTDQNDLIAFESRKGKQLIYTPVHQIKLNSLLTIHELKIEWHQRWVGKTYADPVHQTSVPSYLVSAVNLMTDLQFQKTTFELGFNVDNIFNVDYEIIRNYPLPGRSFTFQINIRRDKN